MKLTFLCCSATLRFKLKPVYYKSMMQPSTKQCNSSCSSYWATQDRWLIASYSVLKTKSTLHTEYTVTELKDMKMALDTEDQEWVKEDIWASVVYLSRDCVSPRGLSRFGKSWSCREAKSAAESIKGNGRLREQTTVLARESLWRALLWFFTSASRREAERLVWRLKKTKGLTSRVQCERATPKAREWPSLPGKHRRLARC